MNTRKLSLFLCLCLSLCVLSACTVNVATESPAPDGTISEAPLPSSSSDLSAPEADSSTDTAAVRAVYESDLGFTLDIPDSWLLTTESGSTHLFAAAESENSVRFYDIASAEAGYGGTLVTICLYEPGEAYDYLPDYELLAECEAGSFVAQYPTDVQTDPENPEVFERHLAILQTLREDVAEGFHLS